MDTYTVYLASDHRGVGLKAALLSWFKAQGLDAVDLGPFDATRCDASDYAVKLAEKMRAEPASRGVLICGTGQAMTMTANRFQHVKAALCLNGYMARLSREHNDANVLVLGAELVGEGVALDIVQTFMQTAFLGGRYAERTAKLASLGGV